MKPYLENADHRTLAARHGTAAGRDALHTKLPPVYNGLR